MHAGFMTVSDRVLEETSNSTSFTRTNHSYKIIYLIIATSLLKIDLSSFVSMIRQIANFLYFW